MIIHKIGNSRLHKNQKNQETGIELTEIGNQEQRKEQNSFELEKAKSQS